MEKRAAFHIMLQEHNTLLLRRNLWLSAMNLVHVSAHPRCYRLQWEVCTGWINWVKRTSVRHWCICKRILWRWPLIYYNAWNEVKLNLLFTFCGGMTVFLSDLQWQCSVRFVMCSFTESVVWWLSYSNYLFFCGLVTASRNNSRFRLAM